MTPKCVAINRNLHSRVVNCVTQPHTFLCPLLSLIVLPCLHIFLLMCPSQSRTRCCCCLCCRACFAAIFCYLYWIFSSPSSRADEHLAWPSLSLSFLSYLAFSFVYLPSRVRCFSGVCHQMSLTRFALCCISSTNINTRQKAATTRTTTTTTATTREGATSCISIIYLAISMPTLYTPFTLCWATSAFSFLTV